MTIAVLLDQTVEAAVRQLDHVKRHGSGSGVRHE
jgi:hypothetical protein